MSLSIKISKKVGERSDMIASRSWPQNKISIGRGEECTLVLEDPKKHVSRVHVELEEKYEGTFQLTVVSKVNPVFVNGKKHAPGSRMALTAGDRFELGEYELELLAPPKTDYKAVPVLDVEETTRPDNPMLQMPKAEAAKPVPEKTVPVETAAPKTAAAPAKAEEPALDHSKLPPVEPGIFDEPEAAEAPPAAAEGDVFAESTYVGASSAPPSNLFDEATYVGGRPQGQGAAPAAAGRSAGGGGGMRELRCRPF